MQARTVPRPRLAFALGAVMMLTTSTTARAQNIDTRTGQAIAQVTTPAFGQTFTAPLDATGMLGFSFFLATNGDGPPSTYRAYLMRWNGARGEGPVLYASAVRNAAACCSFVEASFVLADLPIVGGASYVAFIDQLSGTVINGGAAVGGAFVNSYAGGSAVFTTCATTPTSCDWGIQASRDVEFTATFSRSAVVPEPSTLALAAAGMSALIVIGRRRLRS